MDFSKYATPVTVTVKATKSTTDRSKQIHFIRSVAEQGFRLSYHAVHAVTYGTVTRGTPTYKGVLERLPIEMQYVVCRKDGTYSSDALLVWAAVAPEDFDSRPVIQAECALQAFAEFLAE